MTYDNLTKERQDQNDSDFSPCNYTSVLAFSQAFLPSLYTCVFIVGFIGNTLVVCMIVKYCKWSNMSDLCIFNLAISDILFIISLPFWAHYTAILKWSFGSFMCHAVTAFYMLGFYGSIFFMILMTIHRYTVIVQSYTSLFPKHQSVKASMALVLFMWTLSLGASLPTIIFSNVSNGSDVLECRVEYSQTWKLASYIELNVLGLIVPLSVMVFCYSHIIPMLMTMKSQKKHKIVRLMLVLITVFFLFWMPYNIVIFLKFLHHLGYMPSCKWNLDLHMAMQWVETLAFSHCCLNPIIYAFVGQKFRNLFLKILKEWFPHCFGKGTTTESEYSDRRSTMHSRSATLYTMTK